MPRPKRNKDKPFLWHHPIHGHFFCSRWELAEQFPDLCPSALNNLARRSYSNKSHKGWVCDKSVGVHWYHPEHGVFRGTQRALVARYGGDPSRLSKVANGKSSVHRGWVVRSDIFA